MDATMISVVRLFEQGCSKSEICRRLDLNHGKVTQILVTAGAIQTEESQLKAQGRSVDDICDILGKSRNAVLCRLPYDKGMYHAEYPTINALRIRKHRKGRE